MLVLTDLSGIQDFLFHVQEIGGKQAKSLRFRSLYIQLLTEAISVRLLKAGGLGEECRVFSAAGKTLIDAGNATESGLAALDEQVKEIQVWLRDKTQGRLRLNVARCSLPPNGAGYIEALHDLQKAKLQPWAALAHSDGTWRPQSLQTLPLEDPKQEAERDAELGRALVQRRNHWIVLGDRPERPAEGFDLAGLSAWFAETSSEASGVAARNLNEFARYVPTDKSGKSLEFADLADRARGASFLAILKADVDNLGAAVAARLIGAGDLQPLQAFSAKLDTFFAHSLDRHMRNDARWQFLYTIFSGGDDVLLAGPWDVVVDFAANIQRLFSEQFQAEGLTLSAGIAFFKPRFPIRLAAQQAENNLHQAKSVAAPGAGSPKDQCCALGQLWKWNAHGSIAKAGKQLADWCDARAIERGWLHTLLELALLRRGDKTGRDSKMQPAIATSRLAYHIGRNWPKPNHRDPLKRAVRKWVDSVLDEFDRPVPKAQPESLYLPAVIRYAMLATRRAEKGD